MDQLSGYFWICIKNYYFVFVFPYHIYWWSNCCMITWILYEQTNLCFINLEMVYQNRELFHLDFSSSFSIFWTLSNVLYYLQPILHPKIGSIIIFNHILYWQWSMYHGLKYWWYEPGLGCIAHVGWYYPLIQLVQIWYRAITCDKAINKRKNWQN